MSIGDFKITKIHTPGKSVIPQANLRVANDRSAILEQLPPDKDAKILVYCLTSEMAKKAVATLLAQGYTNLWMLDGGTTAWEEAGLGLEKK